METPTIPTWWEITEKQMSAADPSFKHRPQQAQAASILDAAIRSRTHVALDLPTGSGKSVLALAAAEQAAGRTVISTATRALQSQLRDKDIPALQAAGVLTRSIVVLEGRSRYACYNRAIRELDKAQPASKKIIRSVLKHLRSRPEEARQDQIPVGIPEWVWSRICSDSDACGVQDCRKTSTCAYTVARDLARVADIVIVSHALLLADASIKDGALDWGKRSPFEGETVNPAVLGPYQHLVIDEAHALEGAAESHGEVRVSIRGIQALATKVSKLEMSGAATRHLADCLDEFRTSMLGLPTNSLLAPTGSERPILGQAIEAADAAGKSIRGRAGASFDETGDGQILINQCYGLRDRLKGLDEALRTGSDKFGPRAVSAESAPGRDFGDATGMRSQLVDASKWLNEHVFDNVPTIAMSGTLAVPGRREWVINRVGLDAKMHALPTSFDLRSQRLVYVTPRVEAKGTGSAARSTDADVHEIQELIQATDGRALVLFPAVADLKYVHSKLKIDHTLLGQGITTDGKTAKGDPIYLSNAQLSQRFTEDTSSVLLGTRSYFEGVDFSGETASIVIIVRFPNLRPSDPLTLARRNLIEGRGGSAWTEYAEPAMQLLFRQAAGRAIRRVDDKGIVAVLDPRCASKAYAKTALKSLYPSDFTHSLDDVRGFLA